MLVSGWRRLVYLESFVCGFDELPCWSGVLRDRISGMADSLDLGAALEKALKMALYATNAEGVYEKLASVGREGFDMASLQLTQDLIWYKSSCESRN